ncbi:MULTISPECIES: type II toxin-antitoxin system RelE/ParE family toxin [Microbacterium]|jgi:mRNA interferase RelE/StbE|uniref:type II toxin-antitoxin system RelE family toxin n=1 Tax=Microbacterium TaxID=33882 RepID=UPI001CBAA6F3|nr:type II toxin-antitoxin system RelE/ParE family toxin [Microbacterium sp. OVT16B]
MRYRLTPAPRFEKQLRKLDRSTSRRILVALYELAELEDPTVRLKPLQRELAGLWRLRVGDHRVVLDVRPDEVVIVAVDVGHRRSIYR